MSKAVFPGSFDPFTIGHKDIADRALKLFDHLVIGIGYNLHKSSCDSIAQRVKDIQAIFSCDSRVTVEAYTGLTVDFARRHGAAFIIRGLREVKDFEYERNLADTNSVISDIETVFLTARPELGFVSSSMVRELTANGYDASRFLPKKKGN